jgi:ribosome biogenesis GTPase A
MANSSGSARLERRSSISRKAAGIAVNERIVAANVDTLFVVREPLPFVDVVAVSALTEDGLAPLQPYLRPASSVALVGSSGVGKSTILNRLVGGQRQRIAPVSEQDGRGQHTTTARHLIVLPGGGGLLIDTPLIALKLPEAAP